MSDWFRDGEAVENVRIDDRAFQYGDGLFETIAIRAGQPRFLNMHLDRLERGCERFRLLMPARRKLGKWLASTVGASNGRPAHWTAKLILTSGVSRRGYRRELPSGVTTFTTAFATKPIPRSSYRDGVATIVCKTRLALFSVTAGCKTLNRLEQVLARSEFTSEVAFEGLTLDAEDRLICGTMSNVFIVADGSIVTPSLERCGVEGVMRRHVIEVMAQKDITVQVRDIHVSELLNCDEVFLSNSQFGVLPVRACGDRDWQSHPVTQGVMTEVSLSGVPECAP